MAGPTATRTTVRRSARLNPSTAASRSAPIRVTACSRPRREVFVELALRPDLNRPANKRRKINNSPSKRTRYVCADTSRTTEDRILSPHEGELEEIQVRLKALEAVICDQERKKKHDTYTLLEENFTCSLCCEILAHPVSVTSTCGHTFCAACIIKWIFSRLHEVCGFWHTPVNCPNCRHPLCPTPYENPRNPFSFPIVFNRVAANAIESLVRQLQGQAIEVTPSAETLSETGEDHTTDDEAFKWRPEGTSHEYWLKRVREGKRELETLLVTWQGMNVEGFLQCKHRLLV